MSSPSTVTLVCVGCDQVVRCDPVSGLLRPHSRTEKVICTDCASSLPERKLAMLWLLVHTQPRGGGFWLWDEAIGAWEATRDYEPDARKKVEQVLFKRLELERKYKMQKIMGRGNWNKYARIDIAGYLYIAFLHIMGNKMTHKFKPTAETEPGVSSNWFLHNGETKAFLRKVIRDEAFRYVRQEYRTRKFRPLPTAAYQGMGKKRIPKAKSPASYSDARLPDRGSRGSRLSRTESDYERDWGGYVSAGVDVATGMVRMRKPKGAKEEKTPQRVPRPGIVDPDDFDLYWSSRLPTEDAKDALARARKVLSPSQYEAVRLYGTYKPGRTERTIRDVAVTLAKSKSTVAGLLMRARQRVQDAGLAEELGYLEYARNHLLRAPEREK